MVEKYKYKLIIFLKKLKSKIKDYFSISTTLVKRIYLYLIYLYFYNLLTNF